MEQLITKIGKNKGLEKSRIWIEGNRLIRAGFNRGDKFHVEFSNGKLVLTRFVIESVGVKVMRVSGKGDHPIIDITGKKVVEWFGNAYSNVLVTYAANTIIIEGV